MQYLRLLKLYVRREASRFSNNSILSSFFRTFCKNFTYIICQRGDRALRGSSCMENKRASLGRRHQSLKRLHPVSKLSSMFRYCWREFSAWRWRSYVACSCRFFPSASEQIPTYTTDRDFELASYSQVTFILS